MEETETTQKAENFKKKKTQYPQRYEKKQDAIKVEKLKYSNRKKKVNRGEWETKLRPFPR